MSVSIFFCYAHEDEELLNKLKTHLRPLQRQGLIKLWHDRDISAGTKWEHEISKHLNEANIILLLVSPDFMDSDYCYGIEMQRALERDQRGEARVIPIILRHVYWQGGPLSGLQALPTDATPITDPSWHNLDIAMYKVTEAIKKVVEELSMQDPDSLQTTTYDQQIQQVRSRHQKELQFLQEEIKRYPLLYTRRLSRKYPGLFVILIDQSGSMSETVDGHHQTKADIAAGVLNSLIIEIIDGAGFDPATGERHKYAYLSIWGYNETVYPLLSPTNNIVDVSTLAAHPKGEVPIIRTIITKSGTIKTINELVPFWIEPQTQGQENMTKALEQARNIVRGWISSSPEQGQNLHQECFPPIVINITDSHSANINNAIKVSHEIQRERTQNGNVLVFNCHITSRMGETCSFPGDADDVAYIDPPFALYMYEMSSILPEALLKKAELVVNRHLSVGARGMIYNADPTVLIKFLRWGTLSAQFE